MVRPARSDWWNPRWSWKVWGMVVALLLPTFSFALWVLAEAGGQTSIDAATLSLARKNADGPITAITGTEHTIYHANNALPEEKAPRTDGRITLAWFTSGTCKACESQVFAHAVMAEFRDNVVFMEKDIGRDAASKRLGVKDVPAFIWLDPEGHVLGRFSEVAHEAAFRAQVNALLGAR